MSDLTTTPPLHSARPRLSIDGEHDARLDEGLISLSVHESDNGPYRCELVFGNWGANSEEVGFLYFGRDVFDFGRELTVEIGDGDAEAQVFAGRITGIEGRYSQSRPPEILILAEDRLQDLRMVRRSRTFEDVSVDDVIQQIAQDHQLQSNLDLDSPTYRVLAQVNQSDMAFMRECTRGIDALIWIEGDTIYAQARSRRQVEELTLTYEQRLKEFSVLADLAHQRTHLAVGGWDVTAKAAFDREVGESAIQSELDGDISGSEILGSSFGRRRDTVAHLAPESDLEVQALVDCYFKKTARRFVTGRGVAEGDGRLRAGARVTLQKLGDMFNGSYYVTEVQHSFSLANASQTYFAVERPGIGTN